MLWTIIGYDPDSDELCVEYVTATNASQAMENVANTYTQEEFAFTPMASLPGAHDVTLRDDFSFHSNPATQPTPIVR